MGLPAIPQIDFKAIDYIQVIAERDRRVTALLTDSEFCRAERRLCASRAAYFAHNYFWTMDPRRAEGRILPFVLFPRQIEYLDWLQTRLTTGTDGVVLKSRTVGATWLSMSFALWGWLFQSNFNAGFGSRKEDYVDRLGVLDSIFEKGRFLLRWLPAPFLPGGFNLATHAPFMKFLNPENGSIITGEAGDNIGRGGRNTIYFKDESAFYERPELIDAALSENSECKIDVSTPNGPGNPFHKKCLSFPLDRKFVFDWRDDPRKDQAWYDRKVSELEPWIVAQEIDHDFNASLEGVCIPSPWIQAAVGLDIEASGVRVAGLDVADEGGDGNALVRRHGPCVEAAEEWREGNTTTTARRAWRACLDGGVGVLCYDSIGVGAGVKGETSSLQAVDTKAGLVVVGIASSEAPSDGIWEGERSHKDMFANLKAELWWSVRRRFLRTWERVTGIRVWADEDCISIPNMDGLKTELGQVLYFINGAGKVQIESKKDMKRRGIASPNLADALMLAFAPAKYLEAHQRFGGSWVRGRVAAPAAVNAEEDD